MVIFKQRSRLVYDKGTIVLTEDWNLDDNDYILGTGQDTIIKTNGFDININGKSGVVIKDLQIDATGSTNGITILGSSYRIKLENLYIKNADENGIDVVNSSGVDISDCWCVDNTLNGIFLQNNGNITGGIDEQWAPTKIVGTRCISNTQHGIYVDADHDCVISGCHIERNVRNGIYTTRPVQLVITGNTIERNGSDTDSGSYLSADIHIVGDDTTQYSPSFTHQGVIIVGNQIGSIVSDRAIRIDTNTTDELQVIINSNYINCRGNHGVSAGLRSGHNFLANGNTFYASGAITSFITLGSYDNSTHQDITAGMISNNVMDNHGNTVTDYIRIARLDTIIIKDNLFAGNGTNGIEAGVDAGVLGFNNVYDTNLGSTTQATGSPVGTITDTTPTTI